MSVVQRCCPDSQGSARLWLNSMIVTALVFRTARTFNDLVFPTDTGNWQSTDNWRKRGFYAACSEAGLVKMVEEDGKLVEKPKYKPYDLRHFFASMLIEKRVNLKRIQNLMGHEDVKDNS